MPLYCRYLVGELCRTLILALVALTALLTVALTAREAVRSGLPLALVAQLLPYMAVETLGYTLPAATLYAHCAVFGRLAAQHELNALCGAGVHPLRPVAAALTVAYLVSLAALVAYEQAAVWSRPGVQRLATAAAVDVACGLLRTQRTAHLPGIEVAVRDVRNQVLVGPCVRLASASGGPAMVASARTGRLHAADGVFSLTLDDAEIQVGAGPRIIHPGPWAWKGRLPLAERPIHRDWLAQSEIPAALHRLQQQRTLVAARLANAGAEASPDDRALHRELGWKAAGLRAEPHRRWANAFSCLAFAAVGIPVAVRLRSGEPLQAFFAAFLPIVLAFYPLLMLGERWAVAGEGAPAWFWLGDGVLLVGAAALMRRWLRR
jgi:lipopolysaccharide export system permease protein